MKILTDKYLSVCIIFAVLTGSVVSAHAQFSGSVTLGGYHASNVEGRDSATPDNAFTPAFNVLYNWDISEPASLKFEASLSPTLYQEVSSRSYLKSFLGATGSFYLSDIEERSKPVAAQVPAPPKSKVTSEQSKPKPAPAKTFQNVGKLVPEQLEALSELMDSFDIEGKGLSKSVIAAASDLKDSVSETLLALSDIVSSQVFTESISQVITSEVKALEKVFSQVQLSKPHKKEIGDRFDGILDLLTASNAPADLTIMPSPSTYSNEPPPSKSELLQKVLDDIQIGNLVASEKAPVITLVNSQTEFDEFTSSDIALHEDILPLTGKTLATFLSVPITLEFQNNKEAYSIYSHRTFGFKPRVDFYFGQSASLGLTYTVTNTTFPNDTDHFNDGTENMLRADTRIELFSQCVLTAEAGMSFRNYDHPLEYQIQLTPKRAIVYTTDANYSHYFLGTALIIFPLERLSLGVATHITRSSNLRPYLSDLSRARSIIGGNINLDEYSYDLTKESVFLQSRIFWGIDLALDFSYENRQYANVQIPKKLQQVLQQSSVDRVDNGPQIGIDLSKEFTFDSHLLSVFDTFTPALDIQRVEFTSNIAQFSYQDVTAYLSFELGF